MKMEEEMENEYPVNEEISQTIGERAKKFAKKAFVFLFRTPSRILKNPHTSPFSQGYWVVGILLFSFFALIVNSYSLIKCDILQECK